MDAPAAIFSKGFGLLARIQGEQRVLRTGFVTFGRSGRSHGGWGKGGEGGRTEYQGSRLRVPNALIKHDLAKSKMI